MTDGLRTPCSGVALRQQRMTSELDGYHDMNANPYDNLRRTSQMMIALVRGSIEASSAVISITCNPHRRSALLESLKWILRIVIDVTARRFFEESAAFPMLVRRM